MTQEVRHSQFILTYGPGALLETVEGPRLIPLPNRGLFAPTRINDIEQYEITDSRISALLGGDNHRIFHLPSAELMKRTGWEYKTRRFPEWHLCTNHGILYLNRGGCPECNREGLDPADSRGDAIRFVLSCSHGHLSDINWHYLVHYRTGGQCATRRHQNHFLWNGGGGSLTEIILTCPGCNERVRLGDLYNRTWQCQGIYPERISPFESLTSVDREECSEGARILQRQQSNLRIPEIVSLFSINAPTILHLLLDRRELRAMYNTLITINPDPTEDDILRQIEGMHRTGSLTEQIYHDIIGTPGNLKRTFEEIESHRQRFRVPDYTDMIRDEFSRLIEASVNGAPRQYDRSGRDAGIIFEVPRSAIRRVRGPGGIIFRIVPIARLRTVTVQRGYRRNNADPSSSRLVPVSFQDGIGNTWYPGTRFIGEGIFIIFDENNGRIPVPLNHSIWDSWLNYYNSPELVRREPALFRDPVQTDELHPGFVLWHTLSHLMIRSLSIDSGYSAASIRERIYLDSDELGNQSGGVILYTVQPGEGTLGTLIALVDRFERILERSVVSAAICPNDPLCDERQIGPARTFGASCYGCLQISETSCEHRNLWLDRHIVQEYFR